MIFKLYIERVRGWIVNDILEPNVRVVPSTESAQTLVLFLFYLEILKHKRRALSLQANYMQTKTGLKARLASHTKMNLLSTRAERNKEGDGLERKQRPRGKFNTVDHKCYNNFFGKRQCLAERFPERRGCPPIVDNCTDMRLRHHDRSKYTIRARTMYYR